MSSVIKVQPTEKTSDSLTSPKDDTHETTEISQNQVQKLKDNAAGSKDELEQKLKNVTFKSKPKLSRDEFLNSFKEYFSLNEDEHHVLGQRIFELADRNHDGEIDLSEYLLILSLFYADSSEEKLNFTFHAFDLNGDGKISKEEMKQIVTTLWTNDVCRHLFDFAIDERRIEGPQVFVDSFFKEADTNRDDFISFEEYKTHAAKYSKEVTDHKLASLPNQTGGHVNNFKKLEGGKIMKATNDIEFQFYQDLKQKYPYLVEFLPEFYGIDRTDNRKWIIIKDLNYGLKSPCVMDIKMGTLSAGEDADAAKRESMLKKDRESTTTQMGIRITGMKVFDNNKQDYTQYTKSFGRKVTEATFTDALQNYFNTGDRIRYDIVDSLIEKLKSFQQFINSQHHLRFYSSSILFVYDGDAKSTNSTVSYCMIDFAHVFPIKEENGLDDGYILGMKNLMDQLSKISSRSS